MIRRSPTQGCLGQISRLVRADFFFLRVPSRFGRICAGFGTRHFSPAEQLPRPNLAAELTASLRVPPRFPQVIKNVSTLFYDQPHLLHGRDGLEFFVPKNTAPPQPSQWFSWTPQTHNRFGRTSFRVAVRMLLLCEKRSRSQPPDLTKKKVRVEREGSEDSDSEYSSSEEESSDEEEVPKEPGQVAEEKIPPVWDGVTERVLGEFEKLTLEIKPMTDDECWEDSVAQKEENRQNAEAAGRGKRAKPDTDSPPDSPPPPGGAAPRSRKSARIIAKVNRGATYTSYRHLMSGRGTGIQGHGKGKRMSLTGGRGGLTGGVQALSTVSPDLPPMKDVELKLTRNPKEMSLMAADRAGLHQLPAVCMERIIFFLAQAEGKEELHAQREVLMKSLGKAR